MFQKILTLIITFLCINNVSGNRVRRHLLFNEGSRLFETMKESFVFSIDVRDNLFNYNDLFANVFGFKVDWNLPSEIIRGNNKGRIQRRDVYQGMEQLLHQQKINGTFCIHKFLCEASTILPKTNHFFAQLYEIIFSSNDGFSNSESDCSKILTMDECPLSLLSTF